MLRASFALVCAALSLAACKQPESATAQPTAATAAAASTPTLDPDRLAEDLRVLADDGWAGRFTKDLEHLGLAADFIAKSHQAAGLKPVGEHYRVDFEYPAGKEPGNAFYLWVERGGEATQLPESDAVPATFGARRAVVGAPVWVAAASTDGVEGRAVITPAPSGEFTDRVKALADAGATAAFFVTTAAPAPTDTVPDGPISAAWITADVARAKLGVPDGDAPARATEVADIRISLARSEIDKTASAPNVVAWIEGTEHPEEIVLLGAHYDHIGTKEFGTFCRGPQEDSDPEDQICNGADDNASGTALLMNIARAIGSSGYRPKRTLVFASFAAEELGLHGSRALAESPPDAAPFSNGKVVAMLNMDMVGRLGADGLDVGGEKTSPAWPDIIERHTPASLTVKHPAAVTGRSDHAHWFRQGIPVLFFFTGLHDDYHRTSDELDTLNMAGISDIGTLVLGVALELADGAPIPRAG